MHMSVHTVCREWNKNELSHVPQPLKRGGINYLIHTETQEETKIYTVLTTIRTCLKVGVNEVIYAPLWSLFC